MRKGMKKMSTVVLATKKVISSSQKKMTKAQAKDILIQCGILTKDNRIEEAYSSIVVEKRKEDSGKKP